MSRRPDPAPEHCDHIPNENSSDDVAVRVLEGMLQYLSLDATISLLHKQIAKKAVQEGKQMPEREFDLELEKALIMEEYKKAEVKKREGKVMVIEHGEVDHEKQREVDHEKHHSIHDRSSNRRPTVFMSSRHAQDAKLENKIDGVNVQETVISSRAQNTQNSEDANSCKDVHLAKNYAALQKEHRTVAKELEVWKQKNGQLKAALDKAERLLRQDSLAESTSSFANSSATLPLLKEAVDQVRVAAATCAYRLLGLAKNHSLVICNLHEYLHIRNHHFDSASTTNHFQVALQASFLCEVFFCSFESPSCSGDIELNYQSFEKPRRCRQQRLQAFHKLRLLEDRDICMLQQQDAEFNGFMQTKTKLITSKLRKLVQLENPKKTKTKHADDALSEFDRHGLCDSNHEQLINEFLADLQINKLYKISFLRLAKAVWQLHKFAYAIEPASAEIFRVSPDSVYDEEYMQENEDSMMQAKDYDKMGRYLSEKHVFFMSLPGFTVKNSIIKSLVYLIHP